MRKPDPYRVLGVQRSASDQEIKKAYRKLARQHHPDMNDNSRSSEVQFREVVEAYEILGDPEKRKFYDLYGHASTDPGFQDFQGQRGNAGFRYGDFGGGNFGYNFRSQSGFGDRGVFEDLFSEFFQFSSGRGSRRYGPSAGSDLAYDLTIDFLQSFHGVSASIRVLEKTLEVLIPPGVDSGSRIRVAGMGAPGIRGGPAGDLFLNIAVRPHKIFRRERDHIYLEVPITFAEAALGARVEIPSPETRLSLKIPAGTQPGTAFRFKGKGFPRLKSSTRGDFFATVRIVVPDDLDPESRELLAEFQRRNSFDPRRNL
jgi:DnaJ-class molecular chaperone